MKCKVLASTRYSEAIQEIQVERNGLVFEPGNCVDILNPVSGIKRPYSIASAPKEDRLLFYARIMSSENGVSQYIANLKKDDEIEIGEAFGGRDHTTVINACKRVAELKEEDVKMAEDYKNLLRTLSH